MRAASGAPALVLQSPHVVAGVTEVVRSVALHAMTTSRIQELEEQRRACVRNLHRSGLIFGTTGVGLAVLQYFVSIRLWLPFAIWFLLVLSSVGDAVKWVRCRRELRNLSHEKDA